MTVQGGTTVGIVTVLLGGATGTAAAADPGAASTVLTAPATAAVDPAAALHHPVALAAAVPRVLAFTGASHLGLLITAGAVLILAGLLMAGLAARHRPTPSSAPAGMPQWTGRDRVHRRRYRHR